MRHGPAILLVMLSACAPFPALDGRISAAAARADYPTLQPIGPVLAAAAARADAPAPDDGLNARLAALHARAAALRGAIIDRPTRDRMQTGIATDPLR